MGNTTKENSWHSVSYPNVLVVVSTGLETVTVCFHKIHQFLSQLTDWYDNCNTVECNFKITSNFFMPMTNRHVKTIYLAKEFALIMWHKSNKF